MKVIKKIFYELISLFKKKFMKKNRITLTEDEIISLFEGDEVEGYEGYSIKINEKKGEFNAEKGAMTDFPISLYNPKGKCVGTCIGGYFTGVSGLRVYKSMTF